MKRLGVLFFILVMLLTLCACGEKDENAGLYRCVEVRDGDYPMDLADSVLNLDQGGYGELEINGEGGSIRWTREGSELRLDVNGQVLAGTIKDGLVSLEIPEGITVVYAREDRAESYLAERAGEREQQALRQAEWNGDWYGWWRLENAEGELADTWYDLCARFLPEEDGSVTMLLWDEDQSAEEPMGWVRLRLEEDGSAISEDGYFWFMPLTEGTWTLMPEKEELSLQGRHSGEEQQFDFSLCLRPWGSIWPQEERRPYYYESWYLPLIEAGEAMPDTMDVTDPLETMTGESEES